MKYIVTHGGKAHFDEFFAVGLLLSLKFGSRSPEEIPPVYRRDPTEQELHDPEVTVIDIGGRHEPEKNNFDHHQDESLPSSFRLVAENFQAEEAGDETVDELLRQAHEWYEYKDLLDRKGPNRAAHSVGVHGDTMPLKSPVESWVTNQFGNVDDKNEVDVASLGMAALIADQQIERALSLRETIETFRAEGAVEKHGGLRVFAIDKEPDSYALRRLREELEFDATLSVNPRDEGGIAVYRYDDVDLDLKEAAYTAFPQGRPITFAHNAGFFAVCESRTDARTVLREATRLSDSYANADNLDTRSTKKPS